MFKIKYEGSRGWFVRGLCLGFESFGEAIFFNLLGIVVLVCFLFMFFFGLLDMEVVGVWSFCSFRGWRI